MWLFTLERMSAPQAASLLLHRIERLVLQMHEHGIFDAKSAEKILHQCERDVSCGRVRPKFKSFRLDYCTSIVSDDGVVDHRACGSGGTFAQHWRRTCPIGRWHESIKEIEQRERQRRERRGHRRLQAASEHQCSTPRTSRLNLA